MPAWVIPVHDHAIVAEMPDGGSDTRLEIHACQHEPGARCRECDLAVRRLVDALRFLSLGCVDAVRLP